MKKYLYLTGIVVILVVAVGFLFFDNSDLVSSLYQGGAGGGSEEIEGIEGEVESTNLASRELSEQLPMGEALRPIDVMDKWIEIGLERKAKGDLEGTAEAWKQASLANPGSYLPHNNLGFLYRYDIKDPAKAEKSFLDAIAVKSDLTIAYRELSDLYRYAYPEKADQADDILLLGLEKNPENYDLLIYLAYYYRDIGDKQNAKKYFEETLKIKPNDEGILREINKF